MTAEGPSPRFGLDANSVGIAVLRAGWTRKMQLPPGADELTVRVPQPHSQIGPGTEVDLPEPEVRRVDLIAGQTSEVVITADVLAILSRDLPQLTRYQTQLR